MKFPFVERNSTRPCITYILLQPQAISGPCQSGLLLDLHTVAKLPLRYNLRAPKINERWMFLLWDLLVKLSLDQPNFVSSFYTCSLQKNKLLLRINGKIIGHKPKRLLLFVHSLNHSELQLTVHSNGKQSYCRALLLTEIFPRVKIPVSLLWCNVYIQV